MDICRVGRKNAQLAEGVIVVIDVIRAFSVAAYAFAVGAEALWLVRTAQSVITLIPTGTKEGYDDKPNEDVVCADYLQALLEGKEGAREELSLGLARLRESGRLDMFAGEDGDFPHGDVGAVLDIDCFSFVMPGERRRWKEVDFVEVRMDTL